MEIIKPQIENSKSAKDMIQKIIGHNFRCLKIIEDFINTHQDEWIYDKSYIPAIRKQYITDVSVSKPVVVSQGENTTRILNFVALNTVFDADTKDKSQVFPFTPINAIQIPQLFEIKEFIEEKIQTLSRQLKIFNHSTVLKSSSSSSVTKA